MSTRVVSVAAFMHALRLLCVGRLLLFAPCRAVERSTTQEPADHPRPVDCRHPLGRAAEERREGIRVRQVRAAWSRPVLRGPPARRLLVPRRTDDAGAGP